MGYRFRLLMLVAFGSAGLAGDNELLNKFKKQNETAREKVQADVKQALEMAQRLGDKSLEAAACRAIAGQLYVPARDIRLSLQSMERALALSEASDDPSEAAECCLYLEGAYYWMAEIRSSYQMSLRRIEFIERFRYPHQLRNAYSWPALLRSSQGEWSEARLALA